MDELILRKYFEFRYVVFRFFPYPPYLFGVDFFPKVVDIDRPCVGWIGEKPFQGLEGGNIDAS